MAKLPLRLDWKELMPGKDDAAPPEVEVTAGGAAGGGGDCGGRREDLAELSDNQLQDKIVRALETLSSVVASRLSDKGEKLRRYLQQFQEELDRRKVAQRLQDAGKSDRVMESRTAEASGSIKGSAGDQATKELDSQSSFAVCFIQRLEGEEDVASSEDLRVASNDKSKNISENNLKVNEEKEPTKLCSQLGKMSVRRSPFRCVSSFSNTERKRSSDCDCKVTESSSISSSVGKRLCSLSAKRKRSLEVRDSMGFKSKKIQEVVLLDEEDTHPSLPKHEDNSNKWKEVKIYYPSREFPDSVELSYADIRCLDPESYLSSPIMNFYIQYLQRPQSLTGRPRGEYYFFNTYFYKKLEEAMSCKGDRKASFLRLRRWWKGVNIFQKAYIFLPVHGDLHWSLVIICIPSQEDESGPIVLHLDSLGLHSSNLIFDVIDRYLKEEWDYMNQNAPIPVLPISERIWKHLPRRIERKRIMVPQQKNEFDCGLFVLYFMERFIDKAPERLRRKDLAMFGSKWFQPEEASALRERIRTLLLEVFETTKSENGKTELTSSPRSSGDD
ncbi:ubiquitin-like-specific protease 1C isoform X1 [Typha latifolia]|uniref:ubiquitin-like-specific protease 1C isoform X1 n=1 Tax=Typha latifolia TaxID=4733 RepID=UPI003C2EB942